MRVRPTSRIFAIVGGAFLLFAVGTNVQAGWVLAIAALLLGVLIAGCLLPLRSVRGIEVERSVPRTASAGRDVPVTLIVRNTSSRTRGLFRVTDSFLGTGWAVVDSVGPHGSVEYSDRRTEVARGVYESGEITLETGAPFGLIRVTRTMSVTSPIVVHPAVYEVSERVAGGAGGWQTAATFGDVSSVREYRPGDPLRHIHWRSAARRGQLMVREFDEERHADVAVVASAPGDASVADAIASVACSLAIAALRSGQVAVVSHGYSRPSRSTQAILDWGARLGAGPADVGDLVASIPASAGLICVLPSAAAGGLEEIARRAQDRSVLVVLVGERGSEARRLRAAEATVAEIDPADVGAWFAAGCPTA